MERHPEDVTSQVISELEPRRSFFYFFEVISQLWQSHNTETLIVRNVKISSSVSEFGDL